MKNITRTITTQIIYAESIKYDNGVLISNPLPELRTVKKMTNTAIEKHFKALCKEGESILVKEIKEEEKAYSIPVETFMKYAVEVKPETEPQKIDSEIIK